MDKARKIIEQIKSLERDLYDELQHMQTRFSYKIEEGKVYFEEQTRRYHQTLATGLRTYLFQSSVLKIVTAPFIWACLFPALLLDGVVSLYQAICFPVYRIPKVRRRDYIRLDRHRLSYLNAIEKINCLYCGYFNGLMAYVSEIAARTEQHWCPIKHAYRQRALHNRYAKFFEYGDAAAYKEKRIAVRQDFADLSGKQGQAEGETKRRPKGRRFTAIAVFTCLPRGAWNYAALYPGSQPPWFSRPGAGARWSTPARPGGCR